MGLTEMQKKWLKLVAEGCPDDEAAQKAGYRKNSSHSYAETGRRNRERLAQYLSQDTAPHWLDEAAWMREVNDFWMGIVRDPEERTADRIRASELWAKAAGRLHEKAGDAEGHMTEADVALLRKVARRLDGE